MSPRLPPLGTFSPRLPCFAHSQGSQPCQPYTLPSPLGETLLLCYTFTAGFIDFIVEPTFSVLTDVAEKSVQPQADEDSKSKNQPR